MLLSDLTTAFMLLTRLPVGRFARPGVAPEMARCVWAFPVVGLVVNLAAALAYRLGREAGLPPLLAATWTLVAVALMTGALHEDGLADTADGFGGGATPARKLEIMRDSRIGSYGALAVLLSVVLRVSAIAALGQPGAVAVGLILAGMLGRSGMILLLVLLRPARADGLGASVARPPFWSVAAGLGLSVAASFALLPVRPALAAVVLGAGASLVLARMAVVRIGGYTGDVLGATEMVTGCVVLTGLASAFSA
nr:adenosylcobinamide-GDP ribazoletransferase [uncultured Rhodopila sp.]